MHGLGQFGTAVSAMVVTKSVMQKKCVFLLYFEGYTTKDVYFSAFFVILMSRGQCSCPSVRILEELSATVTTFVKKYGL